MDRRKAGERHPSDQAPCESARLGQPLQQIPRMLRGGVAIGSHLFDQCDVLQDCGSDAGRDVGTLEMRMTRFGLERAAQLEKRVDR